ncbi:HAD family hydrolase [Candidatus Woesearchaeota archaeon]|nr:HAD family hydrolase [Candidatus Woesearchaeota archaeon]
MNLYLFDMDNTILDVNHVHFPAYERMYEEVFNVKEGLRPPKNGERTTHSIIRHTLKDSVPGEKIESQMEEAINHMAHLYYSRVSPLFVHANMPNVLDTLNSKGIVALFTGGARKITNIILKKTNLYDKFSHISTCDDAPTRAGIVKHAIERCSLGRKFDKIFVIGDAPEDMRAAKANSAIGVGVAMNVYTKEELLKAGADIAIDSWEDTESVMEQLK